MAYPQRSFVQASIDPRSLLGRRRETVCATTLLTQLRILKETGRYDAFKLQWHPSYSDPPDVWPVPNHLFWDSDIGKWIEGACYFLAQQHLPEVSSAVEELVEMIRSAQQPDGYLNIHFTVVEPEKRFTNLRDMHELYNAGHMIEAALAHQATFKNDRLMEPLVKYVNLLCQKFGPADSQSHGYPGHPEIELALLRLYERTGEEKHLALAKYFLTERGNPSGFEGRHFYDVEAEKRGEDPYKHPAPYPENRCMWYHQAHLPISQQTTVEGHSVRAMYLLAAVADLLRIEGTAPSTDTDGLKSALYTLWHNMVEQKMYVTGGIGAMKRWEGFGPNYFLPQGTDEGGCYAETCAAIGVMMLAERLLQTDLDGQFGDIMELCLYNAVLTAMSTNGKGFTYVNQLASSDSDLSKREDWFTCACCPPNVLRLFGQLGGYIWSIHDTSEAAVQVRVHLYVSSTTKFQHAGGETVITQESNWPSDGKIQFDVQSSSKDIEMVVRIPSWAEPHELNPPCPETSLVKGYLHIPASWIAEHQSFTLSIPLKSRWITQHPYATTYGTLALARGPLIYCVEDTDNTWAHDHFKGLAIDPHAPLEEITGEHGTEQYVALDLKNGAADLSEVQAKFTPAPFMQPNAFHSAVRSAAAIPKLRFVPYHFRANRGGNGHMRVGLKVWER